MRIVLEDIAEDKGIEHEEDLKWLIGVYCAFVGGAVDTHDLVIHPHKNWNPPAASEAAAMVRGRVVAWGFLEKTLAWDRKSVKQVNKTEIFSGMVEGTRKQWRDWWMANKSETLAQKIRQKDPISYVDSMLKETHNLYSQAYNSRTGTRAAKRPYNRVLQALSDDMWMYACWWFFLHPMSEEETLSRVHPIVKEHWKDVSPFLRRGLFPKRKRGSPRTNEDSKTK